MSNKVHGVGINDVVTPVKHCKIYKRWTSMLNRCYTERQMRGYQDVFVCDEWLYFSNFKKWMQEQDWEGKHLDKDLIGDGTLNL